MGQMLLFSAAIAAMCMAPSSINARAQHEYDCGYTIAGDGTAELSAGCEKLIAAQANRAEKANILFQLAFALNEKKATRSALPLLDRAIALAPTNLKFLHERAYTRADLGFYRDALTDSDTVIESGSAISIHFVERAFIRDRLGDFEGSLADYSKAAELENDKFAHAMDRADSLVWLGRLEEAETFLTLSGKDESDEAFARLTSEIARIRSYQSVAKANDAERCDLSSDLSDALVASKIFDACTRAYLDAATAPKKAEFLTTRSSARAVMQQNRQGMLRDLQVAVGLDFDEAYRHMNYGYALLDARRSWAARNAFDEALKGDLGSDQTRALTLGGRAQANLNLADNDAAFNDAKASYEVEVNTVALSVLGDLSFDQEDFDAAKAYWLAQYKLGSRDDGLVERLVKVGVDDPANELAELE